MFNPRIKGKFIKKDVPQPTGRDFAEGIGGVATLLKELDTTKKDLLETKQDIIEQVDKKIEYVEECLSEAEETAKQAKEIAEEVRDTIDEYKEEAIEVIREIKQGEKGEKGEDADEDEIVEKVLSRIPKPKELDEKALIQKVISKIPENKASLKIIQETSETDPMSVVDRVLELAENGKIKFKTKHIDGLEQTISSMWNQIGKKGYVHGGGFSNIYSSGTLVTNGLTGLNFAGSGVSSVTKDTTTGIVTVNISGGGSSLAIGEEVTGGTPGWVLYIDQNGDLFGDNNFTRDSVTNETFISMNQSGGLDSAALSLTTNILGVPGTDGIAMRRADIAGTVGDGVLGIIDGTPLGAPSRFVIFGNSTDNVTGDIAQIVLLPVFSSLGTSNATNESASVSFNGGNQANFGVDNSDGGGNDIAAIQADLNGGAGAQYIRGEYRDGTNNYGWGIDNGGVLFDFDAFSGTPGTYYYFPTADGTNGQILATNGAGQLSFTNVPNPALTQNYIGFGSSLNALTGDASFEYDFPNLQFIQTIPNNTGNSGATTSPLAFGAATFTGSGLNDLTLNWSDADYKSNKYGGNLTIQINGTGTPDTFSWFYTGGYSQMIGSGTGIPITGAAQVLSDNQGRRVGEITFGATTGHTNGDHWNAGTSLSTYAWGNLLQDGTHAFIFNQPVTGQYRVGDAQYLTDLGGNGTRIDINDNIGEMALYAARYFRVETPGGNTAVLADMQNDQWVHYTGLFDIRNTGATNTWFTTDGNGGTTQIGNVSGAGLSTLFSVNDASRLIDGYVEDAFGGYYGLQLNGSTQVGGLYSNDGVDYTGLIRATNTSTYIQSQDSNTGLINVWQTTATSALGQSTDGVDSITLQLNPTTATITGLTNSVQFLVDDTNEIVSASLDGDFRVADTLGAVWLNINTPSKFGLLGDNTNAHAYLSVDSISDIITLDSKDGSVVSGDTQNSANSTKTTLSDSAQKFTFATGGTDRFIAYKDWTFLGGAVVSGSIQSYTSTGNVTINDNVATLQYNPGSVNATATITLPATSGGSGSRVTIVFGGTITSGNPVVTALTMAPNTGNTIVDSNAPTTANAGDVLEYIKIGTYWYRVD